MPSSEDIRFRVHGHSIYYVSPIIQIEVVDGNNIFGAIGSFFSSEGVNNTPSSRSTYEDMRDMNRLDLILRILGGSSYEDIVRRAEQQSAEEQELNRNDEIEIKVSTQRYDTTSKSNESCLICLDDFEAGDMVTVIDGCGHILCTDCLKEWGKYNAICPACKTPIPTE